MNRSTTGDLKRKVSGSFTGLGCQQIRVQQYAVFIVGLGHVPSRVSNIITISLAQCLQHRGCIHVLGNSCHICIRWIVFFVFKVQGALNN